jgi:hypothetical protein
MVLKVLAEHLGFVSDVRSDFDNVAMTFTPSLKPRGALMMAIQAVSSHLLSQLAMAKWTTTTGQSSA